MIFGAAAIGYLPVAYAGGIGALAAASDAMGKYFSAEETHQPQLDEEVLKQLADAHESGYKSQGSTTASEMSDLRSNASFEDLVALAEGVTQEEQRIGSKKSVTFADDLEEAM
jgi:hypothetical protein